MQAIKEFLNPYMLKFIISFISADIAIMLSQAIIAWILYENLGIQYVTAIALIALLVNTIANKKLGFLLDSYPRVKLVITANIIMITLTVVALVSQSIWVFAMLSVLTGLYFSCFYAARGAIAQLICINNPNQDFTKLNSMLVVTDKLGAILVGVIVASLFSWLGADALIVLALVILLISTALLAKFNSPTTKPTAQNTKAKPAGSFAWFFQHKIARLIACALVVTIVIMAGGTINRVVLYDVLKLTPDFIAYTSIAYNSTAIIGDVMVNWIKHETAAIYACIGLAFLMSCLLVISPSLSMFIVASALFGLLNSINRVLYDSVIMRHVANEQIGTFYSLLNSLNQGSQFLILIATNAFLGIASTANELLTRWVIVFYPTIFLLIPAFLWLSGKYQKAKT
ncbi:MFS transporter [Moraxella cuniculi]|uniref:H+ Antiporter protein n=1 Tax=Moraxella cuniculi TaxID=34061 RepID=A0A448GUJ5_9GAMM|nr:MFS transporter [Moraxella cuniculi]VEG12456.1 H+ Antiporter protein [Moraxella cuniculi]